jgi:hypothetical protein
LNWEIIQNSFHTNMNTRFEYPYSALRNENYFARNPYSYSFSYNPYSFEAYHRLTQPLTNSTILSKNHPTSHRLNQTLTDSLHFSQNHPTSHRHKNFSHTHPISYRPPTSHRLTQPLTDSPSLSQTPLSSHRLTQPLTDSTNFSQIHPTFNRLTQPLRDSPTSQRLTQSLSEPPYLSETHTFSHILNQSPVFPYKWSLLRLRNQTGWKQTNGRTNKVTSPLLERLSQLKTPIIVDTTFGLQRPRAAHALRSELKSFCVPYFVVLCYNRPPPSSHAIKM